MENEALKRRDVGSKGCISQGRSKHGKESQSKGGLT